MSSGPLFRTELTAVDTGCDVSPRAADGAAGIIVDWSDVLSVLFGSSHSAQLSGAIIIGILSWILPTSSVASVVMIAAVHSQACS